MDFYWETELYPKILGWDIKVWTNCRFGMMFWGIGGISFACAQYEHHQVLTSPMIVSVTLQLLYVFKFLECEVVMVAARKERLDQTQTFLF